ncbi:MAG: GNAT family N-acetyltransferase [Myxococcales bacterium]|nr:MAG: GNAT family N-acetyltransferase [Myxococcales bacterium]
MTKQKDAKTEVKVRVRRARIEDAAAIYACQKAAYASLGPRGWCDKRQLKTQIKIFPEGQLVATIKGNVVGYAMALIVQLEDDSPWYSYTEITGGGTFSTHDPAGDTLYGADIAVHPDFQGLGVSRKLYEGRKTILRRFNLKRMVAGGRIPGYQEHAGKLSAEEYIDKVLAGELRDRALNSHIKAGYKVRGVHMGYLRDAQSLNYATFLELSNPRYRSAQRRIAGSPMKRPVRKVRVCTSQYEMRRVRSWEDFEHQVDFFVATAEQYHSHFLLLPELFTVQLFSLMEPSLTPAAAIAELADLADRYKEMLSRMAKRSGLFIIGGSHPIRSNDGIRNVAHLFTPGGQIHTQEKLHITPNERNEYGITRGDGLKVFETSYARIAILVCYDIEFPELARLLTLAGTEILFVPFSTDERKAYLRIRYSAQARSVENVIYTVLAGNVGNLPQVENFLINYGQAAICTPSDFPFPPDGLAAVGDFNSETVVISDLDLVSLEETREMGSVRPLRDRRADIFELRAKKPVELVVVN